MANRITAYSEVTYIVHNSVQKGITSKSEFEKSSNIHEDILIKYTIENIHGLDVLLALQQLRCYTLPHESLFDPIIRTEIVSLLARRHTIFEEILLERKFKRHLGFYGFKIVKLCMACRMTIPFR